MDSELQSQAVRPGDPAIPANDMIHEREQSGQEESVQDNVD